MSHLTRLLVRVVGCVADIAPALLFALSDDVLIKMAPSARSESNQLVKSEPNRVARKVVKAKLPCLLIDLTAIDQVDRDPGVLLHESP